MKLSELILIIALSFAIGGAAPSADTKDKKPPRLFISQYENVLGTSLELKTYAGTQGEAAAAEIAAINEIARMQKILSAYDPASEFSEWLKTKGQPIHVSSELFEVLGLFDRWRTNTNGALDASAEIISRLWKQSAAKNKVPTPEELQEAISQVKRPHWLLDSSARTATHLDDAPLMLNSFAKSYIIRHAASAGTASGKVSAMVVNIGGDLVISGDLIERVNISDPKADAENDAPIDYIQIGNKAIATSGNYRRGEFIAGHWYSHIVDPRSGQPADNILSATVVASDATVAGALATAFNVLTPQESIQLATHYPDAEYLILTRDGQRIQSEGWKNMETTAPKKNIVKSTSSLSHWNNNFELIVNLEITLQKENFAKRPYVAVWIEDGNHAPVRTISLWHERDKYLPELKSWYLKYRGQYADGPAFLGSVSSATRSAGKYSLKWDGKDDKGNDVKPGVYTLKIEASREHGTYQLIRQEINLNQTPQKIDLPGNVEITSASIDYRKKSDGN